MKRIKENDFCYTEEMLKIYGLGMGILDICSVYFSF